MSQDKAMMSQYPQIILASSSPYRRELLSRLQISFSIAAPNINEEPLEHEQALDLSQRLAIEKAQAIANKEPQSIVIGSDQCAEFDGLIINKPGNYPRAVEQLKQVSGKVVTFYTGLAVVCHTQSIQRECVIETQVKYRQLTDDVIQGYLRKDEPFDCAGSGKIESLGIALVDWVRSDDPSALIGLPLIKTSEFLRDCGVRLF